MQRMEAFETMAWLPSSRSTRLSPTSWTWSVCFQPDTYVAGRPSSLPEPPRTIALFGSQMPVDGRPGWPSGVSSWPHPATESAKTASAGSATTRRGRRIIPPTYPIGDRLQATMSCRWE